MRHPRFPAVDRTTGGAPATRYVNPATGKYVVINDTTGQVIQVSKPGYVPH
ncbi:MAG: colicin E5-related ribonuclease [Terriglobia bacterium]